ncbi:MAG: hypothetical protein ACYTFA_16090 [Planctomycetota bacterium]|jgi:hypothetical protein
MRGLQIVVTCVTVLAVGSAANRAWAQSPLSTAITYQGQLKLGGIPVNDTCDFEFSLWSNAIGTLPSYEVGPTLIFDAQGSNPPPITVTSGLFTADLDFGADAFNGSPAVLDQRWLNIRVACPSGGVLQPLSPRQPLRATPYALQTRGLYVDTDRNIGMGTTTPTNRLSLWGNANIMGNVGIGEANPDAKLHIVGPPAEGAVVQIDTVGEDATALNISATGYPGFGIVASATDTAIFGSSPIEGGTFYASGVGGRGLAGIANAATGAGKGVYGRTDSPDGHAGYFLGRGYFSGNVGIGQEDPQATLHLGGTPNVDGIMFPDGTVQTTAAVGGGGGSLWSQSGSSIFYTAGKVGIGTSSPQGKLHLAGANANLLMFENGGSPFLALGDSNTTVGWVQWSSPNDELDIYTYGHNYPIAIGPTSSGGVFVDTGTNSGNVGIGTSAPSEDLHVAGDSRFDGDIGIGTAPGSFAPLQVVSNALAGIKSSTSLSLGGAGVWGDATSVTGETWGVYGTAASSDGVGVKGESAGIGVEGIGGTYGLRGEADGSVGFSFGVAGRASTAAGRGVTAYNSATEEDPIAIWGGTASPDGFGGFFQGRGYFRDAVNIGGSWEPANQLTVRDDPFYVWSAFSSIGVRDHTALIENEHTPGILQRTGVLALRAHSPVGGNVNYITFYQKDADTGIYRRVGSIEGDGTGGIVLESLGGDYAEWLPVVDREEKFEPGDVVGVVGGRISRNTDGVHQVMVISTAPIVIGNQPPCEGDEHNGYEKVAFIGQAPVKVRGAVAEGDFIIPSGLHDGTGVCVSPEAITSEQFSQVIGQAWESSDEPGLRRVRAVIGQLPPDPTVARMAGRIEELENETETLRNEAAALHARLESLEAIVTKLAGGGNGGK